MSQNNSSQESLPLSQETFDSLLNMMDLPGRAEMLSDIDVGNSVSSEYGLVAPVQTEASSPLGAHVPPTRSSLPATCSWPGIYDFQLLFGNQENVNKQTTWIYSQVDNKLYVEKDALCPFSFQTNTMMSDNAFLRAMAVYTFPEHASTVVHRCLNHSQKELVQGVLEAEHLIRCDSQLARYIVDENTKRQSVIVPFENPPVGQDYSTYVFKFACYSSCSGGPNRRALALIFTLEQGNDVLGRIVLDLKICACPSRDKHNAEKKLPQSTTLTSASNKRKTGSSSITSSPNFFENFPKKKKFEEKTEKEEFVIKVKDVECFNFLTFMKKLFLTNRRLGRLPSELQALFRLYKSSSEDDEN